MVIGGSSAISGEFLSIQGHTLIQGQGSTSGTTALEIKNSSSSTALKIRDDLRIGFRGDPDPQFTVNIVGENSTSANGSIRTENSLGVKTFAVDNEGSGYFAKDLRIVNRSAINSTISTTWSLEVKGFTSNTSEGAFNFVNSSNDLIMKGVNNQDVVIGGRLAIGQTGLPSESLDIIGNIKANGQVYSSIQTTKTPTGTTETIDWNDGNFSVLDLGSSTGDVTLTLSNPKAGASYFIKIIQGATARDVIFGSNVLFAGQTAPYTLDVTATNDSIDAVALTYDGTNYIANFSQNHG
jgi:hypothetical protein